MNRAIENNSNCCVGCEHWLVSSWAKIEDGKSSMTKDSSIPGTDAFVVRPPSRENSRHLLHRCHVCPGVFTRTERKTDAGLQPVSVAGLKPNKAGDEDAQ